MKIAKRDSGQSIIELVAGLIVFVPIILVLMDCAVIMIGVSTNEAACRDAARAASSGQPGQMTSGSHSVGPGTPPYLRALAVVKDVYAAGGLIKISQTMAITETLQTPLPSAGSPVMGSVQVETTADICPPFLIHLLVENGTYEFKNSQSYPYTYITGSN